MPDRCRPPKQILSLEQRLSAEAKRLRKQAQSLPHGILREELLRKARQAETGSHITEWLASPGLRAPQ
jgi:RNase P/RNase MRP subunit p30